LGDVNKEVKRLIRRCEREGLVVERSGGGHWKVKSAAGETLATIPFSPSTDRWLENTLTQLRRRGIELD
jgi:predicted RNA binding protein YcfA (HicA-like mRNA interferase family)